MTAVSGLPQGNVTFCFTDIEGSTCILEHLGASAYSESRSELDVLVASREQSFRRPS